MMIWKNNQRFIKLTKNSEYYIKTKHIDIHHHYIRKVKSQCLIHIEYVLTTDMMTNNLIKSLFTVKFLHFIDLISLIIH